jgi:hypothetical protein
LRRAFVALAPLLTQSFTPAWLCLLRRGHLRLLSATLGLRVTSGESRRPPAGCTGLLRGAVQRATAAESTDGLAAMTPHEIRAEAVRSVEPPCPSEV